MLHEFDHLQLSQLPSLPEVLVRLLKELNGENLNLTVLKSIISLDPVLVLRIMTIVNSPLHRRRQEMTSIDQAVNLIGIKLIKVIAVSVSLHQFIDNQKGIRAEELNKFWIHSLTCGLLSRAIAASVSYPEPEEAYIVGILHDLGQLILLEFGTEEYRVCYADNLDEARLVDSELQMFGISHVEIASTLFQQCQLEPLLFEAIRHHHDPVERIANAAELVKILYLANALSNISSIYNHPALAVARSLFGMNAEDTLKMCLETQVKVVEAASALEIPISFDNNSGYAGLSFGSRNSHEAAIKSALAKEISHSTLLTQAEEGFDASSNENQLLISILQTATVLFEPRQIFFFEWDSQTNLISGRPLADQPDSIRRIRFPLELNKSLVADALLWNTPRKSPLDPDSSNVSIVDEQITRLTGTDSMLCVPVASSDYMYGALVLGYPAEITQGMEVKFNFMTAFASLAANSINKFRHASNTLAAKGPADLDEYKLNVRKIIHEINNPLALMKNYLRVLEIKLGKNSSDPVNEIRVLNEEIDRVSTIIKQLASSSETKKDNLMTRVNVNAIAMDVINLFENSTPQEARIRFETRLDGSLLPIYSDQDSIKQILINLLKNAVEAMTNGGSITIATALTKKQNYSFLTLTVSDTGPGVPEKILGKLFTGVESTKGGSSAGLGLSIVAGIVKDLGGQIIHRPTLGSGATFIVTLPYKID